MGNNSLDFYGTLHNLMFPSRSQKRARRTEVAAQKYAAVLNEYKRIFMYTHLQPFDLYLHNFTIYKNQLKFISDPSIDFSNTLSAFEKLQLSVSKPPLLETTLLSTLKKLLSLQMSPYHKAASDLYMQYGDNTSPFMNPQQRFYHSNGHFYLRYINQDIYIHPLYGLTIKKLFNYLGIVSPNTPLLKRLFRTMPTLDICEAKHGVSIGKPFLPTIFTRNSKYLLSYSPTSNSYKKELIPLDCIETHQNFRFFRFNSNHELTPHLGSFLYNLSKGDWNTLKNLAILFASMASSTFAAPYIYTIPPENKTLFLKFLALFFNENEKHVSFKKLLSPKGQLRLIDSYLKPYDFLFVSKVNDISTVKDIDFLKKLISGKIISYQDTIFGKITYKNVLPIICAPETYEEITFLKNNFKCINLDIQFLSPHPDTDYLWLNSIFILYGLKLLSTPNIDKRPPIKKLASNIIEPDFIVNEFLNKCCITKSSPKHFTYASTLYEAYQKFYLKRYTGTPPKRIDLVKQLKATGQYEYKRPHVTNNAPNKYAFIGIELKENYIELINNDSDFSTLEEEQFYLKLKDIDDTIRLELDKS